MVFTAQAANNAKLPYVTCSDIGKVAAMAFDNPSEFQGKKINLIGDFISGDELAQVLSKISGKLFNHKVPPMFLMWIFARVWIPLRKQFEIWGRPPYPEALLSAIEQSKKILPEIMSFEQYLKYKGWDKKL